MKMHFVSGNFDENIKTENVNGLSSIKVREGIKTEEIIWLRDSRRKALQTLDNYDVFKCGNVHKKNIYCIYSENDCLTKEKLKKTLNNLQSRDIDVRETERLNITNYYDAPLEMVFDEGYPQYKKSDIYWDIINDFIIVIGNETLKKITIALQKDANRFQPYLTGIYAKNVIAEEIGKTFEKKTKSV